jgi:capsid portal protein
MFLKTIKQVKLPKQMVHRKTYFFIDYQNKTRKEYNLAEGSNRYRLHNTKPSNENIVYIYHLQRGEGKDQS